MSWKQGNTLEEQRALSEGRKKRFRLRKETLSKDVIYLREDVRMKLGAKYSEYIPIKKDLPVWIHNDKKPNGLQVE